MSYAVFERLNDVLPRYHTLLSKKKTLEEQVRQLETKIASAKKYLHLEPEIKSALEQYQYQKHQESIGLYETLLTQLVHEILPEQADDIEFELSMERNAPVLEIYLGKNANRKDIMSATGGSLTNILSTGLRIITLMRSNLRQFVVFDEADCWLETKRVPAFARLIHEICSDLDMQCILISHHEPDIFTDLFDNTLILFKNKNDKIDINYPTTAVARAWRPDQPGIRWIRGVNFMIHEDTYAEFAPGSNVLFGPNHHGKSALLQLIRSISNGEGRDEWIRKGSDFYEISMGIENNMEIIVRRVLKTSAKGQNEKMVYTLKQNGTILRSAPSQRGSVPDFIEDVLNIRRVDDLDVQLQHQKNPIFLLNETPSKRAKLLSSENSSNYLQTLMSDAKQLMVDARATVRQGELDLNVLLNQLKDLEFLNNIDENTINKMSDKALLYQNQNQKYQQALLYKSRWEEVHNEQYDLSRIKKIPDTLNLPNVQLLKESAKLQQTWDEWHLRQESVKNIPDLIEPISPDFPEKIKRSAWFYDNWKKLMDSIASCIDINFVAAVPNVNVLMQSAELGKKWHTLIKEQDKNKVDYAIIEIPTIHSLNTSAEQGKQWFNNLKMQKQLQDDMRAAEEELRALNAEKESVIKENGICIFCGHGEPHDC